MCLQEQQDQPQVMPCINFGFLKVKHKKNIQNIWNKFDFDLVLLQLTVSTVGITDSKEQWF